MAAWNAPDYLHVSVTSTTTILIKILPVNEFAPELTAVRVHSQSPMDQFSSELFSPPGELAVASGGCVDSLGLQS